MSSRDLESCRLFLELGTSLGLSSKELSLPLSRVVTSKRNANIKVKQRYFTLCIIACHRKKCWKMEKCTGDCRSIACSYCNSHCQCNKDVKNKIDWELFNTIKAAKCCSPFFLWHSFLALTFEDQYKKRYFGMQHFFQCLLFSRELLLLHHVW